MPGEGVYVEPRNDNQLVPCLSCRAVILLLGLFISAFPLLQGSAQQVPSTISSQPSDPNFSPFTDAEVRALVRKSDLIAKIRVVTFSPATLEEELHSDKVERTSFQVLEIFKGHPLPGILKMVCVCSGDTWSADTKPGRELILFARYNPKSRLYEPAGEGYEQSVYPTLRSQIKREIRKRK